jgi:hypothetical protein
MQTHVLSFGAAVALAIACNVYNNTQLEEKSIFTISEQVHERKYCQVRYLEFVQ